MMVEGEALEGDDAAVWPAAAPPSSGSAPADAARLHALRHEHFEFVWRSARRLGVPEADADDAVQQVFIVAAGKLASIDPARERAFLFGTAIRVAAHVRRGYRRRGEVGDEALQGHAAGAPGADELLDQRRARAVLDEVLDALPLDARAVFVLFELEEMTVPEIAALIGIPLGTAASRLRRGRELFEAEITRWKARLPQRLA